MSSVNAIALEPVGLLLVEDDFGVRESLKDILERDGYVVSAKGSIQEALATDAAYTIAVLDIVLPDGSGTHLARTLRSIRPELDIVFLTANASVESAIEAIELSAVRYLQKPCHPAVVLNTLSELTQIRRLLAESKRQSTRISTLNTLLTSLVETMDPAELPMIGVESLRQATNSAACIYLQYSTLDVCNTQPKWTSGQFTEEMNTRISNENWASLMIAAPSEQQIVRLPWKLDGNRAAICVYLPKSNGEPIGAFLFENDAPWDMELLELMGAQLAAAFGRARLHTHLKIAYDELRATHLTLLETEKQSAVGRLAAGIAHEIGTPLNIVAGRIEVMLNRAELDENTTKGLHVILSQNNRIIRLIRQLLDYSRAESGDQRTPIRLSAVLAETLPLVETRSSKATMTIKPEVMALEERVVGSFHQLQQVVLNLVLNSVDAGATEVVLSAQRQPSKHVLLAVADNGEGIPESNLDMVFDPFFTTKARGEGTGLGLAVVRNIVREHGGKIWAENGPGKGARFCVLLPTA